MSKMGTRNIELLLQRELREMCRTTLHWSRDCPNAKDNPTKCYNCHGQDVASSIVCPVYEKKSFQDKRSSTNEEERKLIHHAK